MNKRESSRLKDTERTRVLDDAARKRRHKKVMETLEQDNFQDDPHANLVWNKKAPKFDETSTETGSVRKKKKFRGDQFKLSLRKSLQTLLEEEEFRPAPNYLTAKAPPSKLPQRRFCSVCGEFANYVCIVCGSKFCCVKCRDTHQDTRCLRWIS